MNAQGIDDAYRGTGAGWIAFQQFGVNFVLIFYGSYNVDRMY